MPNWCANNLKLSHSDSSKLHAAVTAFEQGRFLEHFVPLPGGEWDYEFCMNSWGTKWDVNGDLINLGKNTAQFSFDSAWAPPIEAYREICAQGFELEASYYEPGMAFVGKVFGNQGDFVDDYYEYGGATSNTVRDIIGAELDDEWAISENMAQWEDEDSACYEEEYDLPPHTD